MSAEAWIAIAALAVVVVGGTLGAFVGWLTAMWWKLAKIETNQAVANSLMATHLEHDTERFEDYKGRLDRHSVRLDDIEGAISWHGRTSKTDPRRTWLSPTHGPRPIVVDDDDSDPNKTAEPKP